MILGIVPFSVIHPAWVGLWSHLGFSEVIRGFGVFVYCL
jgi:hypothetical protein